MRLIRWVLLPAAAVAAFLALVDSLHEILAERHAEEWSKPIVRQEGSSRDLFESLVDAGLVRMDPDTLRLSYAPADLMLRQRVAKARTDAAIGAWPLLGPDSDGARYLAALHELERPSVAAATVRNEIMAWNGAHSLAAIRDSRSDGNSLPEGQPLFRDGDLPNQWDAELVIRAAGVSHRYGASTGSSLPAATFGYAGWDAPGLSAPLGDWRSAGVDLAADVLAGSGHLGAASVAFVTRVAPGTAPFRVDVIGDGDPIVIGGQVVKRRDLCSRTQRDSKLWALSAPDCGPAQKPQAHRFSIAPGTDAGTPLRIEIDAISKYPDWLDTLRPLRLGPRLCGDHGPDRQHNCPDGTGHEAIHRVGSIELACVGRGGVGVEVVQTTWLGAASGEEDEEEEEETELLAGQKSAASTGSSGADCTLRWHMAEAPEEVEFNRFHILAADGTALTGDDGQGYPTRDATALGLVPVVGLGTTDRYGLGGALARLEDPRRAGLGDGVRDESRAAPSFKLTIAPSLQQAALETLRRFLAADGAKSFEPRLLPRAYDDKRVGTLIIVDAGDGPERGAILAAATFGTPPLSRSVWNNRGRDNWRPFASPLAVRAWARSNSNTAPGSSFKMVAAMALIREAVATDQDRSQGDLLRAIRGDLRPGATLGDVPPLTLPKGVWLEQDALHVERGAYRSDWSERCGRRERLPARKQRAYSRLCNFEGESHFHASVTPAVSTCPPFGDPASKQYGLCEATATSMNTWFMAVATSLDQDRFAPDAPNEPLRLATMADRLLGRWARDLTGIAPESDGEGREFRPERFWIDGIALSSERLREATELPREDAWLKLALNSIGQDVQVTPVAIAGLYASIASGCVTRPYLAVRAGKQRPGHSGNCKPLFFDRDEDRERRARKLMDRYLKPGLRAVVAARHFGTSERAFRTADALRPRVHAKTGTATAGNTNTAWLAGWVEPPVADKTDAGKPGAEGTARRLAFACMVTHTTGTGGEVCSPIVREVFERIDAERAAVENQAEASGRRQP